MLFGLLVVVGSPRPSSTEGWSAAFVVVNAVALWWRRRYPRRVLSVIAAVEIANWIFLHSEAPSGLAVAFAVFAVSAYDRSVFRLWVVAAAIAITVSGVALLLFGPFPASNRLIPTGVLSLIAWMAGDYMRSRRNFMLEIVGRHQQERERAAEAERLRIARELHDVVAHNVSLIAIQAGAARVSGNSSPETLAGIEQGARDTLTELNKLLGVLRKSPDAPGLAPQPTLNDVDTLLKPARDAGLEATLKVEGTKRPLSAALDLSAYRIIQEAVTNVLKHASATRVEVVLDYRADGLMLTVSDNGTGPLPTAPSTGHGLVGMRERVELFGGDLTTGSSSLGGFTLRATLPVKS